QAPPHPPQGGSAAPPLPPPRPPPPRPAPQPKPPPRNSRGGAPPALGELRTHPPAPVEPADVQLADAQLSLARAYGLPSWPRLVLACRVIDAIWSDDTDAIRELIRQHPQLLTNLARRNASCKCGPPMTYAANLGRHQVL